VNYAQALAYLNDHASYETSGRIESPTLARMQSLMDAAGQPQLSYPVIHITGTNGKGSTSEMITQLLMSYGLVVGTYRSPHLERVNERVTRNDEPISDEEFAEQIAAVADLEALSGTRPTYFEAMTTAAYRWFADVAVDVAVIEVGLLGRWDATNVADAQVAVVTNIGLDHMEFAGPSKADIAREKAGIVKPNSAVVIGEADPDLAQIFLDAGGATAFVRGEDFDVLDNLLALGGRMVDLRTPTTIYPEVYIPLHGSHQGDNAAVALMAVEAFFASPPPGELVTEAFASVEMPGRFEILGRQPLVIVDGAHNPAGADVCSSVFFDDFNPEGRRLLVVGCLRGRDPAEMLAALRADEFDTVFVATAPSPRGLPADVLAKAARQVGCDHVVSCTTVEQACDRALHGADGDDAILIAGSLYVVGAARPYVQRHGTG